MEDSNLNTVSLKYYVERLLAEKERHWETRLNKLAELASLYKRQTESNEATMTKRIDILESGGAPFASRLDDNLRSMKEDVATLKTDAVRQTALNAVRDQNTAAIEAQRKQIKYIIFGAVASFSISLALVLVQLIIRI